MKIILDIPESLIARAKHVVESGDYKDAQEFIQTAIENQIELEEEHTAEAKTLEEAMATVDDEQSESSENNRSRQWTDRAASAQRGGGGPSLTRRQYDGLPTVDPPAPSRLDEGPLWGQYNRIFPVKVVVRGLANEILDTVDLSNVEDEWLALSPFRQRIASAAREIGSEIATHDERRGRARGDKLAAGLPTGNDAEKSMDRFETHFVGRVEHGDELTGAPPHLALVDIVDGSPQQIGLTEAGREFASLDNPLLDDGPDADQALSTTERQFYLSHVAEVREDEYAAMQKVAQAISEGDDRPSSLTDRVAYLNPEWSNSQAETIRSGLTSRMSELGLLDRRRVGQRGIAYELTHHGETFRTGGTVFASDN